MELRKKNGTQKKKMELSSGASGRALGEGGHTLAGHCGNFGLPKELFFLHTPLAGEDKESKDSNIWPGIMMAWAV